MSENNTAVVFGKARTEKKQVDAKRGFKTIF